MTSQFALMEFQGVQYVIDAAEMSAVENHAESIKDGPLPGPEQVPLVAYGVFVPQPSLTPEAALAHALGSKGTWLGHIGGNQCHLLQLVDIRVFGVQRPRLKLVRIPFSALILATEYVANKLISDGDGFISAFVRYGNISAADNILNRRGVFAFSTPTPRFNSPVQENSWGNFINRGVAIEVAKKLK
jgi:hypothetical protein